MISLLDIEENTCKAILLRYPETEKYCGLCHYSSTNIINRLDNEISLLNNYYNKHDNGNLTDALFKYYLLTPQGQQIFITKQIFNIIRDNYDSYENKFAILTGLACEYTCHSTHISKIIDLIVSKKMNIDFDKTIVELTKGESLSNNNVPDDGRKVTKSKKTDGSRRSKSEQKSTYKQDSILQFLDNQINSLSLTQSKQQVEDQLKTNSEDVNEEGPPTTDILESITIQPSDLIDNLPQQQYLYHSFSEDSILNAAIVGGIVVLHSNPLSISTRVKGYIATYLLDTSDIEQAKVVDLLLSNSNIYKIFDDIGVFDNFTLGVVKKIIKANCSIHSSKYMPLDYFEWFKSLSTSNLNDTLLNTELLFITEHLKSTSFNVSLSFKTKLIDPIEVIRESIKDGVFNKYTVKYTSHTSNTLHLQVDLINERESLDRIFNITRKLMRQANQTPQFEVTING